MTIRNNALQILTVLYNHKIKGEDRLRSDHPERWLSEYRLRASVECVFSMIKTTVLNGLACKKPTSQKHELLIAVICHNIRVLIETVFRFGINPFSDEQ